MMVVMVMIADLSGYIGLKYGKINEGNQNVDRFTV